MASPMSASPALMAMMTVRTAEAPVAQALLTLYTGMPVWPICFWMRWPRVNISNWLPTAMTFMSWMVASASVMAARETSDARSTTSFSG